MNKDFPHRGTRSKQLNKLDSVLNRVMSGLGLDKRLKEHTLIDLWPVLAGEPWCRKSRALFVDQEHNLVISVADASTGQELSLLKPQLIKQINTAAKSLGIAIKGIRLDLKHFHSKPIPELDLVGDAARLPQPEEDELEAIELTSDEIAQVAALREELAIHEDSPVSCVRVAALLEKELKLRKWRLSNGYPLCTACGIPAAIIHGPDRICMLCHYTAQA
jgi:hypothetical protein